jgi:hypothetical protein
MRVRARCSLALLLGLLSLPALVLCAEPQPILAAASKGPSIRLPSGWRFPKPEETVQAWRKEFASDALLARADFDGDGNMDEARLVVREDGSAVAVAVSLGKGSRVHILGEIRESGWLETIGIALVKPGKYRTACGKGYYDCKPDEPKRLTLNRPGVNLFKDGGVNSFLYWDARSGQFKQTWMSD